MKPYKSLTLLMLAAVSGLMLASCGQNNSDKPAETTAHPEEVVSPTTPPATAIACYDAQGDCTPQASVLSVDSVKIVYEHRPSEIVISVRNRSDKSIARMWGKIDLYGENGEKYDDVEFVSSNRVEAGETVSSNIYLGDKRVHPNQEWNRDIYLYFAPLGEGRFSFIGSDNDWCECIAKVVSVRITHFELGE